MVAPYEHGVNTPNDIPAMLSIAAAYEFLPVLRASVEYHFMMTKMQVWQTANKNI